MTISSTIVVKELEYWFNKFLFTTKLNKNDIYYPASIFDSHITNDKSFIRLLFDDSWPKNYTSYNYKFKEISFSSSWPQIIRDRLCIYASAKLYEIDSFNLSSSENLFNLKNDDFLMLNKLLDYRTFDSTNIDTIQIDSTASYETVLANLINLFLDLQINNNYSNFNNMTLLSNSLLTSLYEVYVVEKMFDYVSSKGS